MNTLKTIDLICINDVIQRINSKETMVICSLNFKKEKN